jgi:O-antigen biosynthesis protein WbqP
MYLKIKRFIDIIFASIGLIFLSPILLFLIIGIKITSKGPVLFKQERIGKNKTHFRILKFRTMRIDTPKDMPTHLLESPERYITTIGRFLRKTSLDELPQLWNIFVGQMSFVGPRPALWNQYDLLEEREKYGVNAVVPGLTGWAQINGRDELTIEMKAKLDGEYVEKLSFSMDVKCFFWTIIRVVKSDGVVEGGKTGDKQATGSKVTVSK